MISRHCVWALLGVCSSLLVASGAAAAQAAESAAQHASARDASIVCRRITNADTRTRTKECATRAEWRAQEESKVVCLWGTVPGAETRQQFCNTLAQWRALGIEPVARRRQNCVLCGPGSAFYKGDNPIVPGFGNGGTAASQTSFQRIQR